MLTRTPLEGYLGCCAAIRDADLTAAARALAVPTLCMVGDLDGSTPPALVAELAGLVPDGQLATSRAPAIALRRAARYGGRGDFRLLRGEPACLTIASRPG